MKYFTFEEHYDYPIQRFGPFDTIVEAEQFIGDDCEYHYWVEEFSDQECAALLAKEEQAKADYRSAFAEGKAAWERGDIDSPYHFGHPKYRGWADGNESVYEE